MGNRRPAVRPLINAILGLIVMGLFVYSGRGMSSGQRWVFVGLLAGATLFSLWRAFLDPGRGR